MVYCERCELNFYTQAKYNRHTRSSPHHYICEDCGIDWPTWPRLKEHYIQSPQHDFCRFCDEHFEDEDEHRRHNDEHHWWCRSCNVFFPRGGELGLQEHNRQSHADRWCIPCKRLFASPSNLSAHQRGSAHTPRRIPCRGRGCNLSFVSLSAMTLHLEQGACVSGMNRARVNERVVALDRNNIITNPARLIGGGNAPPTTSYFATERSYNGHAYECYLCDREFGTLRALNAHLNSPRHQEKIYRCPKPECRKQFTSLSGIIQHVESQACGVYQFRAVNDVMGQLSSSMGRLTM